MSNNIGNVLIAVGMGVNMMHTAERRVNWVFALIAAVAFVWLLQ